LDWKGEEILLLHLRSEQKGTGTAPSLGTGPTALFGEERDSR
jgi:hypothetical protein